jgi:hypothetical protein
LLLVTEQNLGAPHLPHFGRCGIPQILMTCHPHRFFLAREGLSILP